MTATEQRNRQTTALLAVAAALNRTSSLQELMPALAAASAQAVGCDRAEIHAYEQTQGQTIASGYYGFTQPSEYQAVATSGPQVFDVEAEIIRTRRPLIRRPDTLFVPTTHIDGWVSDIVVPLVADDVTQGVLYVWAHDRDHVFDDDDVELLQAIGHQAGLAILGARDAESARRRADHLTLLNQTGRALSVTLNIEELCPIVHAHVSRVLVADAFYVALFDETTSDFSFPYLFDNGQLYPSSRQELNDGPTSEVLRSRRSLLRRREDGSILSGTRFGDKDYLTESAIYVPMLHGDEAVGVLSAQRYDPVVYDPDDVRTLETIAQQVAAAFAHAQLYAETVARKEAAERQTANLEAVLATTRAITSRVDLSLTLNELADHLERLIPHRGLLICRHDAERDYLTPSLARQAGQAWEGLPAFPVSVGMVADVARGGEAAVVNDLHARSVAETIAVGVLPSDAEHLMAAPLTVGDEMLGMMLLYRSADDRFTEDDCSLFRVLAGQAGVAIHASLLLDEERRRRLHATVLVNTAATVNRAGRLGQLVHDLSAAAATAVNVDRCSLYLYNESATRTIVSTIYGGDATASDDEFAALPPSEIPVERELLRMGAPITGDLLHQLLAERPELNTSGQRGGAAIPLTVQWRVQGAMYVWKSTAPPERTFDLDEIELLEAIADQAGVAVERARLAAATNRRVAELRLLGRVNAAIARSLDPATVARDAVEPLQDLIPFDAAVVTLGDDGASRLRVIHVYRDAPGSPEHSTELADAVLHSRVYLTEQPYVGESDPRAEADDGSAARRWLHIAPLNAEGRVVGTLCLSRHGVEGFTDDEVGLTRLVAGQLAIGLERARMHDLAIGERERSEQQAERLRRVLASGQDLALQADLDSALRAIHEGIEHLVPYTTCAIYQVDHDAGELVALSVHSTAPAPPMPNRVAIGAGISGDTAARRIALCVCHAEDDERLLNDPLAALLAGTEGGSTAIHAMSVPLVVEGILRGALTVSRTGPELFSDEEFAVLQVYAGQAAAALRGSELVARNRELFVGGVRALASAVDAKDPYTRGHSERVGAVAGRIATCLDLDRTRIDAIELAGLLHDIGKIGVPDAILQKPGPLDDAERAVMVAHAAVGEAMLAAAGSDALLPLAPLVRHHHEWVNGQGYPDGLAGEAIPIGAAILAVADAYDTIVTDRPYRRGRVTTDAVVELRRAAGTQFRPDVVEALVTLIGARDPSILFREDDEEEGTSELMSPLAAGQMGDTRALGLLVELAAITHHIPDLRVFLGQVAAIVRRRLDYRDVLLLLTDAHRDHLRLATHDGSSTNIASGYQQLLTEGICGEVIRSGTALNVPDLEQTPWHPGVAFYESGAALIVPLLVHDQVIGVIAVLSHRRAAFTSSDETVLTAVAGQVAAAIHVAQLHDAAKRAALIDGLTGVANHRAFYDSLDGLLASQPDLLSVILFDVEDLKQVNDSHGHLAGDAVLRRVARTIRDAVRASDVVARYGGDEFAVVMPNADATLAAAVAHQVRTLLITSDDIGVPRGIVRFGVATYPFDGQRATDLIAVADRRLYVMHGNNESAVLTSLLTGD